MLVVIRGVRKLETLVKECKIQVQGLNKLQEFRILYEDTEIEQKESLLDTIFVKI